MENERRLLRALDKAANLTNAGDDPDTSILKVAQEFKLSPPELCRVVETYNKARSVAFLKTAGQDERANDFPLADTQKIADRLYNTVTTINPAAESLTDEDKGVKDYAKRSDLPGDVEKLSKAAHEVKGVERGMRPCPESLWRDVLNHRSAREAARDFLKTKWRQSNQRAHDSMRKVASYCEHAQPKELDKVARNIVNAFGPAKGNAFIAFLNKNMLKPRMTANLEKTAHAVVFPLGEPYLSIIKTADACAERDKARADMDAFEKFAEFDVSMADVMPQWTAAAKLPEAKGQNDEVIDMRTGLNPEFAAHMKALKGLENFYKLYMSDKELQSYPLEDVLKNYNELSELTPELHDKAKWSGATLRRAMAQGGRMDPFEVKDMLSAESERSGSHGQHIKDLQGVRELKGLKDKAPADHSKKVSLNVQLPGVPA